MAKKTTINLEGLDYIVYVDDSDKDNVTYSFDQDEWYTDIGGAYHAAKEAGTLQVSNDGDGGHVFIISLVRQLKEMKVGETLKIMRDENGFYGFKESVVFAEKASSIEEINL